MLEPTAASDGILLPALSKGPGVCDHSPLSRIANAVHEATKLVGNLVVRTPLVRLPWLDTSNREVWAKLECWQTTGSFKFRGALHASIRSPKNSMMVTASAGNHGLALAAAAARLGRRCRIFVPLSASELKVRRLIEANADVVTIGEDLYAASRHAIDFCNTEKDVAYISPFANWDVVAGQGTCAQEVLAEQAGFDTVVIPLGGGGLLAGAGGFFKFILPDARIVAVHPQALGRDFSERGLVDELARPTLPTIADGLAVQVGDNYPLGEAINEVTHEVILVDDQAIETAINAMLHRQGILAEGAGAIGVAALLNDPEGSRLSGRLLLVVSGGNIASTRLSQAMATPVRDQRVRKLLGLRGLRLPLELTGTKRHGIPQGVTPSADSRTSGPAQTSGPIWSQMCDQLTHEVDRIDLLFRQHLRARLNNHLNGDEFVDAEFAKKLIHVRTLIDSCNANIVNTPTSKVRARYRFLLQQLSQIETELEWCSPSVDQSREVMFFDPGCQRASSVNYARYGAPMLREFEQRLKGSLGYSQSDVELLATSSGTAAFQLIESFLTREVLRPSDRVLTSPYIYFEAFEHLAAVPWITCHKAGSFDAADIVKHAEEIDARVVFLDPLANIAGLPTVDLKEFAGMTSRREWSNRWVVIDGTMVSGGIDPFRLWSVHGPKVVYYESASKYLQLGLDLQMAGVCVVSRVDVAGWYKHRRNSGTIMYPADTARFPKFSRDQFLSRMRLLTSNATQLADSIQSHVGKDRVEVGFPFSWREMGWDHGGGVVTVRFCKDGLNNRDVLEGAIERMLAEARLAEVSLTKGVSFGFGTTRVSAAAAMAEGTDPFLRFSIGEECQDDMDRLCAVIPPVIESLVVEAGATE